MDECGIKGYPDSKVGWWLTFHINSLNLEVNEPGTFIANYFNPYSCSKENRDFIVAVRRIYSVAVRTGYANAERHGRTLKEKELREFVKSRFAGGASGRYGALNQELASTSSAG